MVAAQHVSGHHTKPRRRLHVYSVGGIGLLKDDQVCVSLGHTAQFQLEADIVVVSDVVQSETDHLLLFI